MLMLDTDGAVVNLLVKCSLTPVKQAVVATS
jgi:hypothetical protein